MSSARKHKTLTLQDKNVILKRLAKGESMRQLALEYGVGRSTLHDLKKKKGKIFELVEIMENGPGNRKTLKAGNCPQMETALYTWFLQERRNDKHITGEILKAKAIEFYKSITQKDDFKASDGWLDKFKRRFGIRLLSLNKKESNEEPVENPFIQMLQEKIIEMGLTSDQIYSAADTRLLWKRLPKNLATSSRDREPVREINKERISFVACANASGKHKLDIMVVGKIRYPRDLENVCLPVVYTNQTNAWITRDVFLKWFEEEFVPEVQAFLRRTNLPEKALLILDNVPGLPTAEELKSRDGMIQTVFLPANASKLQPIDQNLIEIIKARYKKKLLLDIIIQGGDIEQRIREVNLKNVVYSLAQSWNSISVHTIQSSWEKLLPGIKVAPEDDFYEEDDLPLEILLELFTERNFETNKKELSYFLNDNKEENEKSMSTEEICEVVMAEDQYNSEMVTMSERSVKDDEALLYFNKCLIWAEENGVSAQKTLTIRDLREKVFKQALVEAKKQQPALDS